MGWADPYHPDSKQQQTTIFPTQPPTANNPMTSDHMNFEEAVLLLAHIGLSGSFP